MHSFSLRLFFASSLLFLSACTHNPTPSHYTGGPAYPFAPASLRIHALTHIEAADDGAPVLLCYVELLDRFGDGVKGAGPVTVTLRRPAEPAEAPLVWNIDLADMGVNFETFDRATRLYRFQLGQLPRWALESPRPRAIVYVAMAAVGGEEGRTIDDEFEVAR